jgi:hypothetical protein
MRKNIIVLVLFACLVSFSLQQISRDSKEKEFLQCMKTEVFTHAPALALKLYYGKLTVAQFMSKFLEWYLRTDSSVLQMCFPMLQEKQLIIKSTFSKIGMSILYASNCEKDLGPAFIILDNVISNFENIKKEWKNALFNTITLGLVGYQSFKDCKSSVENIREIWK